MLRRRVSCGGGEGENEVLGNGEEFCGKWTE